MASAEYIQATDAAKSRYARQKERLADTDSNAIYKLGQNYVIRPVLIENGGTQLFVEDSQTFVAPDSLPGFLRYEHKPDARQAAQKKQAEEKAVAETKATAPKNWFESLAQTAEQTKAGLVADKANRLAAQGTTHADIVAGESMYWEEANKKQEIRERRAKEEQERQEKAFSRRNRR